MPSQISHQGNKFMDDYFIKIFESLAILKSPSKMTISFFFKISYFIFLKKIIFFFFDFIIFLCLDDKYILFYSIKIYHKYTFFLYVVILILCILSYHKFLLK